MLSDLKGHCTPFAGQSVPSPQRTFSADDETVLQEQNESQMSRFEEVITTYPPIFEALLLHLPTPSIFDIYHTNRLLRSFLRSYPLAWKNLSFRLLPAATAPVQTSSGFESPDLVEGKRHYALDLLLRFALPPSTCLARLDLDNTSVSGSELHARILDPCRATLQHLSVRGCKDVSIKYHILPWLHLQMSTPPDLFDNKLFALKSLYTYRCRHHRRRPYLPSSLSRRDSDSQPTHQLIELCHHLGIWTDTAWCPTPGGRCYRRRDYWIGRSGFGITETREIWVPFDRLFRSQNFVGTTETWSDAQCPAQKSRDLSLGRLWEDCEYGYGGEGLGTADGQLGEGKELPMHLRKSHRTFVENFSCFHCGEEILERCEQCSIRMHCMGCRKTLCHSCAFNKPLKRKRQRSEDAPVELDHPNLQSVSNSSQTPQARARRREERRRHRFWWAPGASKSPNLMTETSHDGESSSDEDSGPQAASSSPIQYPRLDMHWCCIKPSWSGGGGIAFPGLACKDNVRAAPLPRGKGFENPLFPPPVTGQQEQTKTSDGDSSHGSDLSDDSFPSLMSTSMLRSSSEEFDILPILEQTRDPGDNSDQSYLSPRSLCDACYSSTDWKISCAGCLTPICIEHDIKRLKVRRCGFRKLSRERELVQQSKEFLRAGQTVPRQIADASNTYFLSKWRPIVAQMAIEDTRRRWLGKWTPRAPGAVVPPATAQHQLQRSRKNEAIIPGTPTAGTDAGQASKSRLRRSLSSSIANPSTPFDLLPAFTQAWIQGYNEGYNEAYNEGCKEAKKSPGPGPLLSSSSTVQRLQQGPWTGCGAYFCYTPRAPGDFRPYCTALEASRTTCTRCDVLVCPSCDRIASAATPPCPCKYCSTRFMCPNCRGSRDVRMRCRRREEAEEAVREAAAAAEREQELLDAVKWCWERGSAGRQEGDEMAAGVFEFFEGLAGEGKNGDGDGDGTADALMDEVEAVDDLVGALNEMGVSGSTGAEA